MKGLLDGLKGARIVDLKLINVVLVKGFYINIVSEARLLSAGV
jgi:hypothetical protein